MRRSLKQQKAQKDRDSTPMVKQFYSGPWKEGNAGCKDKEKPGSKLLEEVLGKEEKEKGCTGKGGMYGFDGFSHSVLRSTEEEYGRECLRPHGHPNLIGGRQTPKTRSGEQFCCLLMRWIPKEKFQGVLRGLSFGIFVRQSATRRLCQMMANSKQRHRNGRLKRNEGPKQKQKSDHWCDPDRLDTQAQTSLRSGWWSRASSTHLGERW